MSVASTAAYAARRAGQKERVRILYRRALKDTLNWAVHRHLFYKDASDLRERFDANKHVEDLDTIDRLIADGEANYNKWRHPDPYIVCWYTSKSEFKLKLQEVLLQHLGEKSSVFWWHVGHTPKVPWAPGGSKFTRNPTPPSGIEIVYNYGREDND